MNRLAGKEVGIVNGYSDNPTSVNALCLCQANGSVTVAYASGSTQFELPAIGPRPPCYINPRFEPYYPVI